MNDDEDDLNVGWFGEGRLFRLAAALLTGLCLAAIAVAGGAYGAVQQQASARGVDELAQGMVTLGLLAALATAITGALLRWRADGQADEDPIDEPESVSDADLALVALTLGAGAAAGGLFGWHWAGAAAGGGTVAIALALLVTVVWRRKVWLAWPLAVIGAAALCGAALHPYPALALAPFTVVWFLRLAVVAREAGGGERWRWRDVAGTEAEIHPAGGPRYAPLVAAAIVLGAGILGVVELDANLAAMAVPGDAARDAGDLFAASPADADDAAVSTVEAWRRAAADQAEMGGIERPSALGALAGRTLVEAGIVAPVAALLLGGMLFRLRLRNEPLIAQQPVSVAWRAVPLLLVTWLAEAAARIAVVEVLWHRPGAASVELADALATAGWFLGVLRWALLVTVAAPAVFGLVAITLGDADARQSLVLLRVPYLMVGALALVLGQEQVADVFRRLADPDGWQALVAGAGAVILAAVAFRWAGDRAVRNNPRAVLWRMPGSPRFWGLVAGVGGLVALLALQFGVRLVAIPAGISAAIAALSAPVATDARRAAAVPRLLSDEILGARLAAAAVAALFALGAFRSAAGYLLYERDGLLLLGLGAVLTLVALIVYRAATTALAALAGVGLAGVLVANPLAGDRVELAQRLGSLAVLALFGAAVVLVLNVLVMIGEAIPVPPAFELVSVRRWPVLTLLGVWAVVAAWTDPGGYHRAEVAAADELAPPGEWAAETPGEAFADWLAVCGDAAGASGERPAVPLVFVSAAGGGIRAAYWTALVLEALEADLPAAACERPIFAASGASGGSIGLVTHVGRSLAGAVGAGDDTTSVRAVLGDDYLAPAAAQLFSLDLPRGLLGQWDSDGNSTADRARVLERAFEAGWAPLVTAAGRCASRAPEPIPPGTRVGQLGFLATSTACDLVPRLFLSGTDVNSGCRLNVATVAGGAGGDGAVDVLECRQSSDYLPRPGAAAGPFPTTIELTDLLCADTDVRFSTAAVLSARFPFVSPSGLLDACPDGPLSSDTYSVDGGYLENSGAAVVAELHEALASEIAAINMAPGGPCVVPVYLQIDNGYASVAPPEPASRPWELVAPLRAVGQVRPTVEAQAEQRALLAFSGAIPGGIDVFSGSRPAVRALRVEPLAHPGVQAPLGWALSEASRADLEGQLAGAAATLDAARAWFTELTCGAPAEPAATPTGGVWELDAGGVDDVEIDGTRAFVASPTGVRAVDVVTGEVLWTQTALTDAPARLTVAEDRLRYVGQEVDANLELATGDIIDQMDLVLTFGEPGPPPTVRRNGVTIRVANGQLQVRLSDDVVTARGAGEPRAIAPAGDWILLGLPDGRLVGFDSAAEDPLAALRSVGFE